MKEQLQPAEISEEKVNRRTPFWGDMPTEEVKLHQEPDEVCVLQHLEVIATDLEERLHILWALDIDWHWRVLSTAAGLEWVFLLTRILPGTDQ